MARGKLRTATLLVLTIFLATSCGTVETLSTEEALGRLKIATTKLYAADGSLAADLHGEINRDIAKLSEIPKHVQNAVIAIEDRRFWSHNGLDLKAIIRALRHNADNGSSLQGASTIPQQLVKNIYFPKPERTIGRKITEARLTLGFEREYSKKRLLEMYLNTVYFGRGVYGIRTAADSYFRKDPKDLTVPEAAFLAGLIHEPGRYTFSDDDPPDVRKTRRERGVRRRAQVLRAMREEGYITAAQFKAADGTALEIEPAKEPKWRSPYFVDMALRELGVLGEKLDKRFDFLGRTSGERATAVYRGGLRIHTTLDPTAQMAAEKAIKDQLPDDLERLSAALVSVEPGTGYVRAVVGGQDYYPTGCDVEDDEKSRACRIAKLNLALGADGGGSGRQPGSSFKTFVLAAAIEEGVSLRSSFSASPYTQKLPVGEWKVRNYEGSGGGSLSVVDATVKSVNAAYARLEVQGVGDGDPMVGAAKVADVSRRLGMPFPKEATLRKRCGDQYGQTGACTPAEAVPAIALGAKEVSPLNMAAAYATFAADGVYARPTTITKVTDSSGKTLFEAEPRTKQAVEQKVARGVTHVLRQVIARGTGTRARISRPAAGKTGTSQMWRDAWFVGYVPQLATAVWVGNPIPVDGEPESMTPANGYPYRVAGGTLPAPIWGAMMRETMEGRAEEDFPEPPRDLWVGRTDGEEDQPEPPEEDPAEHEPAEQEPPTFALAHRRSGAGSGSVPGVIGMSVGAARAALMRAGYSTAAVRACSNGGGGLRVWRQSPGGGASASRGSTVTIWYNGAVC